MICILHEVVQQIRTLILPKKFKLFPFTNKYAWVVTPGLINSCYGGGCIYIQERDIDS